MAILNQFFTTCISLFSSPVGLSLILLPLIIYHKQVKNTIKNEFKKSDDINILVLVLFIPISTLFLPLIIVFYLTLFVYRKFIDVILKRKYGSKYGGLLKGSDSFFSSDNDEALGIVHYLMIVNYDGEPGEFYNIIKNHVDKTFFSENNFEPKLTSIRSMYLGYCFMLKNEYSVDECVTTLSCKEEVIDEINLQKEMNDLGSRRLPINNSTFWEVVVGNKPVQWKNNNTKQYPVILRFHHSLGDGLSLCQFFVRYFADSKFKSFENSNSTKSTDSIHMMQYLYKLKSLIQLLCVAIISHVFILLQIINTESKDNRLFGQKLSGKKIMLWKTEDNKKYVNMVKGIKNKIPNTSFLDVILTATSGTFADYLKRMPEKPVDGIYVLITAIVNYPGMASYYSGSKINLSGENFTCGRMYFPTMDYRCALKRRLNEVKNRFQVFKNSLVIQANYFNISISDLMPVYLSAYLTNKVESSVIFSNFPGNMESITICNGLILSDIASWSIHKGIALVLTTYDEKFQFGLNVDRALIKDEESAQKVIDGLFKQIDLLDEELSQLC